MARRRVWLVVSLNLLLVLTACSTPTTTDWPVEPAPEPPRQDPPAATLVPPNAEPYADVYFDNAGVNPFVDTLDDAPSTFALDVDTGSYTVARRFLTDGNLPGKDGIRVEEFVNHFPLGLPAPDGAAFAIGVDGGPTPFARTTDTPCCASVSRPGPCPTRSAPTPT